MGRENVTEFGVPYKTSRQVPATELYRCESCKEGFADDTKLQSHRAKCSKKPQPPPEEKDFQVDNCPAKPKPQPPKPSTPRPKPRKKEFPCPWCGKIFLTPFLLNLHFPKCPQRPEKSANEDFQDDYCHPTPILRTSRKEYPCEWCGRIFGTQYHLNWHRARCPKRPSPPKEGLQGENRAPIPRPKTPPNTYRCKWCGRIFATEYILEWHIGGCPKRPKTPEKEVTEKEISVSTEYPKPQKNSQKKGKMMDLLDDFHASDEEFLISQEDEEGFENTSDLLSQSESDGEATKSNKEANSEATGSKSEADTPEILSDFLNKKLDFQDDNCPNSPKPTGVGFPTSRPKKSPKTYSCGWCGRTFMTPYLLHFHRQSCSKKPKKSANEGTETEIFVASDEEFLTSQQNEEGFENPSDLLSKSESDEETQSSDSDATVAEATGSDSEADTAEILSDSLDEKLDFQDDNCPPTPAPPTPKPPTPTPPDRRPKLQPMKYECRRCGKTFSTRSLLEWHEQKCPKRPKKTANEGLQDDYHDPIPRPVTPPNMYQCEWCGRIFINDDRLNCHRKSCPKRSKKSTNEDNETEILVAIEYCKAENKNSAKKRKREDLDSRPAKKILSGDFRASNEEFLTSQQNEEGFENVSDLLSQSESDEETQTDKEATGSDSEADTPEILSDSLNIKLDFQEDNCPPKPRPKSPPKVYECLWCGRTFSTPSLLHWHHQRCPKRPKKSVNEDFQEDNFPPTPRPKSRPKRLHECQWCGQTFMTPSHLHWHQRCPENEGHQNDNCPPSPTPPTPRSKPREKRYRCEWCGRTFKTPYLLHCHRLRCPKRPRESANEGLQDDNRVQQEIQLDYEEVKTGGRYTCTKCDKKHRSIMVMTRHFRLYHERPIGNAWDESDSLFQPFDDSVSNDRIKKLIKRPEPNPVGRAGAVRNQGQKPPGKGKPPNVLPQHERKSPHRYQCPNAPRCNFAFTSPRERDEHYRKCPKTPNFVPTSKNRKA